MTGIERGIEIVIVSDVPTKGTGLGSSSALTVGLLQALFAYKGKKIDNHKLAEMACEVEIDRLKSPIGKQDQYSCLPKGTKILIDKQNTKNIEDIKIGDSVLSYNEKSGIKERKAVTRLFHNIAKEHIILTFSNSNKLQLTTEHPVFVVSRGWIQAKNLNIGDKVIQKKYRSLGLRCYNLGLSREEMFLRNQRGWSNERKKCYGELIKQKWANRDNNDYGKTNMSLIMKEQWKNKNSIFNSCNYKEKQRIASTGRHNSPESIKKHKETFNKRKMDKTDLVFQEFLKNLTLRAKHLALLQKNSPEWKEKCRIRQKNLWENPEYAEWMFKEVFGKRPNKPEKKIMELLNENFPNEWKYVGDGSIWIDHKNPDFININGKKKLIEFFGDYWHRNDNGENRIKHFKKYGFETIIIREKELGDLQEIKRKIEQFTYNPSVEIIDIVNIEKKEQEENVYNIEVKDNNNYFAHGILVHNCAIGGFNSLEFMPDGWVKIDSMNTEANPKMIEWFEKSLMLFYVGGKEANGILYNRRKDEVGHQLTRAMKYLARDMINYLKDGSTDLRLIGDILNTGYIYKIESGNGAVSSEFEAYYKLAMESGATGGKPTGASGGFMLLVVEEDRKEDIRKAMNGLKEVPFRFEKEGSKVIYG